MPSQRRLRLLFLVVMALIISVLFFSSKLRQSSEPDTRTLQDFYHKTLNAMDRGRASGQTVLGAKKGKTSSPQVDHDADGDIDEDDAALARDMQSRLKAAEQKAKDLANAKAPNKPDSPNEIVGIGSSAGGQAPRVGLAGGSGAAGADPKGTAEIGEETDEEHQTELELNSILKKSPVIIFSKSYCPHSKRAKGILLEKYAITPAPYVVELDLSPLGPQLQARLAEMTGRRTVPNVMVNGKSIGGGDDMAAMDNDKTLADRIKSLGKNIEVHERFAAGDKNTS